MNFLKPALLASAACLLLTACSGANPNLPPRGQMEPNKDAQKLLEELSGPNVQTLDQALENSANQASGAGQFVNAAQFYKQLAEKNPENSTYRYRYADALRRAGKYDDAIIQFQKLRGDKVHGVDALEGLGLSYMEDGEFDQAGDALAEVMEQDPKRWRTVNAIGILFTTKQMYPEARQYYAEALVIEPDNIPVRNNWALTEALDHQYDESIRLLTEAQRLNGKRGDLRQKTDLNLALVYAIKGDLSMAEATASPHLTEAQRLNNMGFYAQLKGDDELAKSYLSMALTKSEKYYERAWHNLETLNKLRRSAPSN